MTALEEVMPDGWERPVSWENLSREELAHAVRQGWAVDVADVVRMIYVVGDHAAYYAWGRFDQGAETPLPYMSADGHRLSTSDAVRAFKTLMECGQRDLMAGHRVHMPSVQGAWDTFVTSRGTAIS